jgi:NAD(P)-dependent dehydrogenase (short-subunit alcohol dehydrogenase family)
MSEKIFILGASGDFGVDLLKSILKKKDCTIGLHCFSGRLRLNNLLSEIKSKNRIKIFQSNLDSQKKCHMIIKNFLSWSGGVNKFIQLNGNVSKIKVWTKLNQKDFEKDIAVNLSSVFYISQKIFENMKKKGGKIILTSTSSALHGGGENSLAYGISKSGIISLTKALARFGAKNNIIANAIAPGFINSKFHTKVMKKNKKQLKERLKFIKLNRAGKLEDVTKLIMFLLFENNYTTGEVISVDGGDWI